ncbi:Zinc finger, HIT-type [Niveomyces insectorum RCEF 264]|uniref:Zinc finger, HIT-type n=1 Tax=Niveomyces insectorum RCEF 264 TaxID=1081102 RepID=A0A167YKZ9_9HYPO|nr:Zinc finger, HIT-type [Niveomyces insectorum RCEF 264]
MASSPDTLCGTEATEAYENEPQSPVKDVEAGGTSPDNSNSYSYSGDGGEAVAASDASTRAKRPAPVGSEDNGPETNGEVDAIEYSAPAPAVAATGETTTTAPAPATNSDSRTDDPTPDEPPAAKRRTLCGICHNEPSKYKCPRCPLAYCSVACSRIHKDNHPPPSEKPAVSSSPPNKATLAGDQADDQAAQSKEDADDVRHAFSVLDDAPELKRLFAKYPTLPARLTRIYEATLPPGDGGDTTEAQPSWNVPFHHGGRGGGGRRRGGRGGFNNNNNNNNNTRHNQMWTQEIGLRRGQKALRQARVDPGEDGDGVREYCELVTYLLSSGRNKNGNNDRNKNDDGDTGDAVALVRQEVKRDEARLIEQLMETEGGR